MTIQLAITIAGLILWFLFTKVPPFQDGWWAEFAKLSFFCGLFVTLLSVTGKPIF